MRLGVLSWEKLKNRETHGRIERIVSSDQLERESKCNCWSLRHVYRLDESKSFKSAWSSVSKLAIVIIWNIKSPHVNNLYSCKRYKIITKLWAQCTFRTVLIAERERSIYDGSRFDMGRFRAEPTNYERRLNLVTHLHWSECPQWLVPYPTRYPRVKRGRLVL